MNEPSYVTPESNSSNTIRWLLIGISIICLGLCALGAAGAYVYFNFTNTPGINPKTVVIPTKAVDDIETNKNSMGDPNAPIQMVIYSDYQCPYCKNFADRSEPQLIKNYIQTGKVYFTYRSMGNFVSDNITGGDGSNAESADAAMAAYCAGDQGKFWEYHDLLFANQNGENEGAFRRANLEVFAETLGLNTDNFKECLKSNKFKETTEQDFTDGRKAGVNGTPSFVITYTLNGKTQSKFIEGAQPYNIFQEVLDGILDELGKSSQ